MWYVWVISLKEAETSSKSISYCKKFHSKWLVGTSKCVMPLTVYVTDRKKKTNHKS